MNADPNPAKAIFLEAVERHAPDQWPAFLDRACVGQPDLRGRVEALLEAHREVGTASNNSLRPHGRRLVSSLSGRNFCFFEGVIDVWLRRAQENS